MVVGVVAVALNAAAGLYGAWRWWRTAPSTWFWRILRAAQAVIVLQAALGGVLVLLGHKPSSLHLLYGLLPLLVSFLAEQLRVSSAQMILDARGYESAQAVGKLSKEEQHAIVGAILKREIGVMALAALVIVVLLLRAAATG